MKILALVPLLTLVSAPQALQAQSEEERLEEWLETTRQEVQALREGRGSRLGVGLGNWMDGPVEGLEVLSVSPGGPAEQAGLRAGDLLTAIDEESLADDSGDESYLRLRDLLAATEPGSEVTITYRRDGSEFEAKVTTGLWTGLVSSRRTVVPGRLAQRVEDWTREFANSFDGGKVDVEVELDEDGALSRRIMRMRRDLFVPLSFYDVAWRLQGLQVAELTPALGEYFGVEKGLLVVRAPDDEDIGLEDGDVIRKIGDRTFRDARHATRILRSYEPGEEVELQLLRHKRSRTVRFDLPERQREFPRGEMFTPPWSGPDGHPTTPVRPRRAH